MHKILYESITYLFYKLISIDTSCFYLHDSKIVLFGRSLLLLSLICFSNAIKGALPRLKQFLATESPSKMMKNAFYFTSKALFVLKIFKFLSSLFGHVTKRLDMKDKVNSKFYNVTGWLANNRNTHIVQYFEKQRQPDNEIWSVKGTKSRS